MTPRCICLFYTTSLTSTLPKRKAGLELGELNAFVTRRVCRLPARQGRHAGTALNARREAVGTAVFAH